MQSFLQVEVPDGVCITTDYQRPSHQWRSESEWKDIPVLQYGHYPWIFTQYGPFFLYTALYLCDATVEPSGLTADTARFFSRLFPLKSRDSS